MYRRKTSIDTECGVVQSDTPRIILRMKPDWALRAEQQMKVLGLTQQDLVKPLGVKTRGAVGHYLSGRRKPKPDQMKSLAITLKLPIGELFGEQSFDNKRSEGDYLGNVSQIKADVRRVPLISWVQAGQWNEAVDMFEPGYAEMWELTADRVSEVAFALRVEGDSMEPEFPAGSVIIVDPSVEAQNGDFVIAKVHGEATFKRLSYDAGRAYLRPLNRDYKSLEMPKDGEIVGVIISQNKRYR